MGRDFLNNDIHTYTKPNAKMSHIAGSDVRNVSPGFIEVVSNR